MELSLDRLEPDIFCTVLEVRSPEPLKSRLRQFGLVPGTDICVRYRSPDSGVTAVELRGTIVALRTRELKKIRVRLL
jgi:Fe2+ transport system protein FeoA